MSVPPEYTDARNRLVAFRNKIFSDLVSGRVKAGLDAGHDGMVKFREVIDGLSVVPYIFGKVREKALALRLNGKDVGVGGVAQSKVDYVGSVFNYPLNVPFQVPLRSLPEVDVFKYSPVSDVSLLEKASEEVWRSLFLVQCDHSVFKESPDMSNVIYDYYSLRPMGRADVEANILNPQTGYGSWKKLFSEGTILAVTLTPQTDSVFQDYYFRCYVDVDIYSDVQKVATLPVIVEIPSDTALLKPTTFLSAGKHIPSNVKGVYAGFVTDGQLVGWGKVAESLDFVKYDVVWSGVSQLEIMVNDLRMGTTVPSPKLYSYRTIDVVAVTAYPNLGYKVVRWELDNIQYPPAEKFSVKDV